MYLSKYCLSIEEINRVEVADFFTFCLRHCVPEFQKKMDAASGDEQLLLKKKLLNSLERYFYLVCFGAYCRLEGNVKTLRIGIK